MEKKNKSITLFTLALPLLLLSFLLYIFNYHPVPYEQNEFTDSIEKGGEWFLNNQNEDFIYYEYNFVKEEHPDKSHSMREMGALWSITQIYNFTKDNRYRTLAEKGFGYFEKSFKEDKQDNYYYVNVTPQKIKLGYNAFMILSLLEIEHPRKEEYLEKFASGIMYQQNEDGELRTFFYSDRETGKDYYPGEALVSLMALYEYTNDEQYLNTVQKAFPHYRDYFQSNPNTAFVPWQSRAYCKLYQATEDPEVADFVFEMNDYMLDQNMPQAECSDFAFPRGIVTAVFMEGVVQAYKVADQAGDEERKQCYKNFVQEATQYTMDLQIMDVENYTKEAIGGFKGGADSDNMRVDRNQHAVMAIIEAYELGLLN
ncbi:hypothetical protein ACFL21_03025 [Patescibacteria group bacterium]